MRRAALLAVCVIMLTSCQIRTLVGSGTGAVADGALGTNVKLTFVGDIDHHPDGGAVFIATHQEPSGAYYSLVRLLPDGTLDVLYEPDAFISGVAVDGDGGIFFTEDPGTNSDSALRYRDPNGSITTLVTAPTGWLLGHVALSPSGKVYVAALILNLVEPTQPGDQRIYRLQSGALVAVPGTTNLGIFPFAADASEAIYAVPQAPAQVASQVVKVVSGQQTVFAGTGSYGFSGDGGPATAAKLSFPAGVDLADDGSLLIADASTGRVRRVGSSGTITTIAGKGSPPPTDSPCTAATGLAVNPPLPAGTMLSPSAVAAGVHGEFWLTEYIEQDGAAGHACIRYVAPWDYGA